MTSFTSDWSLVHIYKYLKVFKESIQKTDGTDNMSYYSDGLKKEKKNWCGDVPIS